VLSNEKRKSYYDKYGTIEGEDELGDMGDAAEFMDDLLGMFFGGSSSSSSAFMEMDDFITILEGDNDRATRKIYRDLGRNYRPGAGRGKAQGGRSGI